MSGAQTEAERRARVSELVDALLGSERLSDGVRSPGFRVAFPDEELERIAGTIEQRRGRYLCARWGREGLWACYERGREPIVATISDDGLLSGLLIGPAARAPRWSRRHGATWLAPAGGLLVAPGLLAAADAAAWSATTPGGALADVIVGEVMWLGWRRSWIKYYLNRLQRRVPDLLFGALVASGYRDAALPLGHVRVGTVALAALFTVGLISSIYQYCNRRRAPGPDAAVALSWPLTGGSWLVMSGGVRTHNHHWASPSQRYALDLVALRASGARARGLLPRHLGAYGAYGAQVVSPVGGVIASAIDGQPEQVPGKIRPSLPPGNHVIIQAGTEMVHLCHFRPGSIVVAVGESVRRGDLLGEIGNSGRTSEPHLHIHVEDRSGVGKRLNFEGIEPNRLIQGSVITW